MTRRRAPAAPAVVEPEPERDPLDGRTPIEERDAPPHRFAIFTGFAETDPSAIGFWRVDVGADGLRLERAEVPAEDREPESVSWHELHQLLNVRASLWADLESLQHEHERRTAEIVRLRVLARRLGEIVAARRQALGAPDDAPFGPTLVAR